MKRFLLLILILTTLLGLVGCKSAPEPAQVTATTLPVYEFTTILCENTGVTVKRLITENVSCLHDYTLQVSQMKAIESAQLVITSGAGLETFLDDALVNAGKLIDASEGVPLLCQEDAHHEHSHEHDHGHDHGEYDPHIWLSPANAMVMAENICNGLCREFPENTDTFRQNLNGLLLRLQELNNYGAQALSDLSVREIITFHEGFAYFAQDYDLHILRAVEEESGSEASAAELIELIEMVENHNLPAIFTEKSGSTSSASVIARETGAEVFALDMAMSESGYFDAMYHNIDTIKEAIG